jgi:hypothetical protein
MGKKGSVHDCCSGENKEVKDLDQYCSEEVLRMMTVHLDNPESTVLKNYTIPSGLQTHYYNEIMEAYCRWGMTK